MLKCVKYHRPFLVSDLVSMNAIQLNTIDRLWVFAILFINGWHFALPVTDHTIPIWFTVVQPLHGIFLNELLLITYLVFWIIKRHGRFVLIRQNDARFLTFLIIGLGCLGILSNGANIQPIKEMGEAGRFFLLAAYFSLLIHWVIKYGPTFVLRTLLLGIACAGAVNLYYSVSIVEREMGGLPLLLGQNGPGGILGISVVLSAWLMLVRNTTFDSVVALTTLIIGVLATSISYSKLSMLMAGFGLIAWGGALYANLVKSRRTRRLTSLMLIVVAVIAFVNMERISLYVEGVNKLIEYKFHDLGEGNRSVESRSQYFAIVADIISNHPILGVGYAGFYKAAIATAGYRSDRSTEEDARSGQAGLSNPHNSFLYYASANGIPGLIVVTLLFAIALRIFWRTLSDLELPGKILWMCLAGSYLIYGMTLPSLFNTSILYLPAAIAVALKESEKLTHRRLIPSQP